MGGRLQIQIWHEGRLQGEVPLSGDRLQIGRLPENDLVLDHLSVSRTHALLERDAAGLAVEDLGSQNGVWVDGQRIQGRCSVRPGQVVRIGQHELHLLEVGGDVAPVRELPPRSARGPDRDAAHPSRTRPVGGPGLDLFAIEADEVEGDEAPEPELEPHCLEELVDADPEPTVLVDEVSGEVDLAPPAIAGEREVGAEALAAEETPALRYPGFVVQRAGRLVRIFAWEGDRVVAGRDPECELVLNGAEVSRRHACFEREEEGYWVRDLDSINGVFVNGERIARHRLSVGDEVRIEDFELTFLLDREPVGGDVLVPMPEPGAAALPLNMTMLGEELPPPRPAALAETEIPVLDLVEELDEEDTVLADEDKGLATATQPSGARALRLELEVDRERLPERLRSLLEEMEGEELVLPVRLRVGSGT